MAAINMPSRRREEKKDPLDIIIKGLGIASSIYGIKQAADKQDLLTQQLGLAQAKDARAEEQFAMQQEQAEEAKMARQGMVPTADSGEDGVVAFQRLPGMIPEAQLGQQERQAGVELKLAQAHKARQPPDTSLKDLLMEAKVRQAQMTPGQKKVDEAFAKDYNTFIAQGGAADVDKSLTQLDEAIEGLKESDTATGPMVGLIPKGVRDVVTPEGAAIQDKVEEVVQRNLRLVLGAQFTEKEGNRLIARAYNPRLSESENISRLQRLSKQIRSAAQQKQVAAQYFEKNGSLVGFQGTLPTKGMFEPDRLFGKERTEVADQQKSAVLGIDRAQAAPSGSESDIASKILQQRAQRRQQLGR